MKKVIQSIIVILLFVGVFNLEANANLFQTIKGRVIEKETNYPLPGASIILMDSNPIAGTTTNSEGYFRLEKVPIGRQSIKLTFIGFKDVIIPNMIINSGKETILNISMEENIVSMKEVVISAERNKTSPLNKMAIASTRVFTVEETEKYAGSRGDVARMAMNYAGVSGANDQRNDIIIRGNNPTGLLWKLEGIDIGNPNHFAQQGTTGGPVGMLNNNNLRNSEFYTSAFPAEYGDAVSGVFDLKLKSGNKDKFEFLGQIGFNGFEFGVEGPISKKARSSFIANYRYSTLGIMDKLGINVGTGSGIPFYQDGTYHIHLPVKNGSISMFGVMGTSHISIPSDDNEDNIYTPGVDMDLYNGSDYAFNGFVLAKVHNKKTYSRHSISFLYQRGWTKIDTLSANQTPYRVFEENSISHHLTYQFTLNHKINSRYSTKMGFAVDRIGFDLNSEYFDTDEQERKGLTDIKKNLINGHFKIRAFNQWQIKFCEQFRMVPGVHLLYFDLTNELSVEPRIGMEWSISPKHKVNFAYGLHAQTQNPSTHFFETRLNTGGIELTNRNLGFSKAHHFVLGHDWSIAENTRIKAEVYYQALYNIPVTEEAGSFSLLNTGANWGVAVRDSLLNSGTGRNYGFEFTLEKFYHKGLYYLFTLSLFKSEYKASDGIRRNTAFNGNYVVNALIGKEFKLNERSVLFIDLKATLAGGNRYTPIDIEKTRAKSSSFFNTEYIEELAYSKQFPNYLKADIKFGYRVNSKKITQEWMIYVENISNHNNVLMQVYDGSIDNTKFIYQLGIFPMMQYRIYF